MNDGPSSSPVLGSFPRALEIRHWLYIAGQFFVEHLLLVNLSLPSGVRRRPDRPHGAESVQRNEACLDVIAPGAFEQSAFETFWPRRNAFQHHPRLATRTARALFFCLQPQRDFVLRIGV